MKKRMLTFLLAAGLLVSCWQAARGKYRKRIGQRQRKRRERIRRKGFGVGRYHL